MADKMVPEVAVLLDKERHFRVTMGALLRFQKATGKNPLDEATMQALADELKNKRLSEDIFALLWACLYHEDKSLTVEQVEDMISPGNLVAVLEKFFEAFEAAMPAGKGEKPEGSPLAVPPIG